MYRHWMRYSSQREYFKIAQGVVLAVLALIGYVAVVQPQLISTGTGFVARSVPTGVLVALRAADGRVPDRHALDRRTSSTRSRSTASARGATRARC